MTRTWTAADYRRDASDQTAEANDSAAYEARRGADEWGGGYWSACEGFVDLEQIAREEA